MLEFNMIIFVYNAQFKVCYHLYNFELLITVYVVCGVYLLIFFNFVFNK
jgi:hypothetical protein